MQKCLQAAPQSVVDVCGLPPNFSSFHLYLGGLIGVGIEAALKTVALSQGKYPAYPNQSLYTTYYKVNNKRMGFFDSLGEIVGEVIAAPLTITNGVVKGVEKAIDRITE